MKELVCDRAFDGVTVDGEERRIVVEWFRPVRERGMWRCDWTIHDAEGVSGDGVSFGEDSTQSLLLAMKMMRGVIQHRWPTAYWLETGDDLGLPGYPESDAHPATQ